MEKHIIIDGRNSPPLDDDQTKILQRACEIFQNEMSVGVVVQFFSFNWNENAKAKN